MLFQTKALHYQTFIWKLNDSESTYKRLYLPYCVNRHSPVYFDINWVNLGYFDRRKNGSLYEN